MGTSTILTIDIGNTALKAAVYEGERLVQSVVSGVVSPEVPEALMTCNTFDGIAYCCVGDDSAGVGESLRGYGLPFLKLDAGTPLPIEVDYDSRGSLGVDRVAAAVGVASPGEAVLVADAGTAVTYDAVTPDGQFIGGNIAPGMNMRLEALHRFTARLPRVQVPRELPEGSFLGHDTTSAMILGAVYGIVGSISYYKNHLPSDTRVVMTGGWAGELSRLCDFDVTVDPHLVSKGLNRILIYNENI